MCKCTPEIRTPFCCRGMCKRAPLYLRAVVNDKGGTDALDMPSDTPTDGYRNACGLDTALEGRE